MKKIFTILSIVCVAAMFSSCSSESKVKGLFEDQVKFAIDIADETIVMLEEQVELQEWMLDLEDEEFEDVYSNYIDWQKDIQDEYEDELEDLQEQIEDLTKDVRRLQNKIDKRARELDLDPIESEDMYDDYGEYY